MKREMRNSQGRKKIDFLNNFLEAVKYFLYNNNLMNFDNKSLHTSLKNCITTVFINSKKNFYKDTAILPFLLLQLIHSADPQSRTLVITILTNGVCLSVRFHFSKSAK